MGRSRQRSQSCCGSQEVPGPCPESRLPGSRCLWDELFIHLDVALLPRPLLDYRRGVIQEWIKHSALAISTFPSLLAHHTARGQSLRAWRGVNRLVALKVTTQGPPRRAVCSGHAGVVTEVGDGVAVRACPRGRCHAWLICVCSAVPARQAGAAPFCRGEAAQDALVEGEGKAQGKDVPAGDPSVRPQLRGDTEQSQLPLRGAACPMTVYFYSVIVLARCSGRCWESCGGE